MEIFYVIHILATVIRFDLFDFTDHTKEGWIGRTLKDSVELKNKPITSHVARMVGSADYDAPSKYKIVRQSQPYGTLSGDAGLLFIAYAADTKNFDFMLDRMTGDSEDGKNDDVMRFTKCVTGNYWYFPSVPEFDRLRYVDAICPQHLCHEDEILYGVGFGFDFFRKISSDFEHKKIEPFEYHERSGAFGGDIFIHAKSHNYGKLFELTQAIIDNLPPRSVAKFEDIYGWVYRDGRDLSGFIDGTMNPKHLDDRAEVAINKDTGGSYGLVQKWIHDMDLLRSTPDDVKEKWIGRTIEHSFELRDKSITSHIVRVIGKSGKPPKFRIVRQSQPYGTLSGEAGLLFIAYAANINNFNFMLDRMTGDTEDREMDDVMRFSHCVTGNYWYFPSESEFNDLVKVDRLEP
ncbi:Dyp-type peroxidase, putative [Schistosoma mansoni]|uniref:Dyp-type peroxidase, putative n=1 Tax=Schistosoma mansoni TaxID=6183 RepID=UPI00022C87D3|nr:Dyp-type peroxidase, putative [Schistosoma mansoni]|eukprot:XP_018646658.1 Dyp-type peroxidase, putative [Schistosoma mansoni]